MHAYVYIHIMYMYTDTYIQIFIYTYLLIHLRGSIFVCAAEIMHTCLHAYMSIHTHTNTHT